MYNGLLGITGALTSVCVCTGAHSPKYKSSDDGKFAFHHYGPTQYLHASIEPSPLNLDTTLKEKPTTT